MVSILGFYFSFFSFPKYGQMFDSHGSSLSQKKLAMRITSLDSQRLSNMMKNVNG